MRTSEPTFNTPAKVAKHWQWIMLLTISMLSGISHAHPGQIDENGGHYDGQSYHCEMPGCE